MEDVQDYNDEFEQRLMTIVDQLVPTVHKKFISGQFSESPIITRMKRKKKNLMTNAKRRNDVQILKRCNEMGKEIKRQIISSRKEKYEEKFSLEDNPDSGKD
jgi:hypothetical protein